MRGIRTRVYGITRAACGKCYEYLKFCGETIQWNIYTRHIFTCMFIFREDFQSK